MDVGIVLRFLSLLTFVVSAWMLCPFLYATFTGGADGSAFAFSVAVGFFVAFALFVSSRKSDIGGMRMREALASVTFSWVVASAISALPYWIHGCAPTYADAFFEGMSGYTTTGSTILPDIDSLPRGILLWRSLTHWLGGMGIIVLTLTIMPLIGTGGFQLYSAEAPGMVHEKLTPRVQQTAMILWLIYLALTVTQTSFLVLCGMSFFDALTHSMGTISTGGFSPRGASVAYFGDARVEWIVVFFMFASGANFVLHYHAIKSRSLKAFFEDPEFRFYLLVVSSMCFTISLALRLSGTYETFAESLRFGTFQVVSLVTTTGFVSADYEIWPVFCKALLFVSLFMGGCAGSTAGAIKQVRLLVLCGHVKRQLLRTLSPRAIVPLRVGDVSLEINVVSSCLAFFALYVFMFVGGTFLVSFYEPNLFTAMSGVAATLSNVGPGFGSLGATGNFSAQANTAKWIYSFLMLCGRLELYTVLMLFPSVFWRDGVVLSRGNR